jgi:hypothetical protein
MSREPGLPADQHINKDKALPRSRPMNRHRLPQRCEIRAKPISVGRIMNSPWRGTPHEATAMRNHRTLIASPLQLSGPCSLIDFGSWRRYPHRLLVITDVLERCKTSGCLYRPLEKCMGLARAKRIPNSVPTKLFAEHNSRSMCFMAAAAAFMVFSPDSATSSES